MRRLIFVLFLLLLTGCKKQDIIITTLNEGYDIITVNTSWKDSGCVLSVNDEINYDMAIDDNGISTSQLGEYEVVYKMEFREIIYTCIRIVKVIDDVAPIVSLNVGIDTIVVGEEWIDSFVTATDNFDEDLTIIIFGYVIPDSVGRYVIVYQVTDDSMNIAEVTRVVNVIE